MAKFVNQYKVLLLVKRVNRVVVLLVALIHLKTLVKRKHYIDLIFVNILTAWAGNYVASYFKTWWNYIFMRDLNWQGGPVLAVRIGPLDCFDRPEPIMVA